MGGALRLMHELRELKFVSVRKGDERKKYDAL